MTCVQSRYIFAVKRLYAVSEICAKIAGMTRTALDYDENWLEPEELNRLRRTLPLTYVHGVPVQVSDSGEVERIGLLLRTLPDQTLGREIVGGRVRFHETLRSALARHCEQDLGPLALPVFPTSLTPFHVAEYFPTQGVSNYYDPRQHAVALCYILQVRGECTPRQDALSFDWFAPQELLRDDIIADMCHGQHHIVKAALAHLGILP